MQKLNDLIKDQANQIERLKQENCKLRLEVEEKLKILESLNNKGENTENKK